MDTDAFACDLADNHRIHPTRSSRSRVFDCSKCNIRPYCYGPGSQLHNTHIFVRISLSVSDIAPLPLFRRRVYANHPDVQFKPGPFYMGPGIIGWVANIACISWTLFVCVIFSLPTVLPVTKENMNYASVITVGVIILSG